MGDTIHHLLLELNKIYGFGEVDVVHECTNLNCIFDPIHYIFRSNRTIFKFN